jgi:hypothetical protein
MTQDELARELLGSQFFYYPQHEQAIERIWSKPGSPNALEELVKDPNAPAKTRFLAAEVLFARDVFFIERVGRALVAQIYAEALAKRFAPHANVWGLLWEGDDLGAAGSRFLILGRDAIPALTALLTDEAIVQDYEGSEEATVGNRAEYRIKDYAAYYISRITGLPMHFEQDFPVRDREIARLMKKMKG